MMKLMLIAMWMSLSLDKCTLACIDISRLTEKERVEKEIKQERKKERKKEKKKERKKERKTDTQ